MVKFQVVSYRGEEDESSNVRGTQHHVPAWEYAGREFEPTNEVAWKRKAFCSQQYGKLWSPIRNQSRVRGKNPKIWITAWILGKQQALHVKELAWWQQNQQ